MVRNDETDPLVYRGKMMARLGSEMVRARQHIGNEALRIHLPLLILRDAETWLDAHLSPDQQVPPGKAANPLLTTGGNSTNPFHHEKMGSPCGKAT